MALDFAIIGQRLKKTRLEKKMTQESLAEQLDVSVAFLSRIERGLSHINLKRLSQICSILGVSEGYILNGTASTSEQYLISEFNEILSDCPADKQKLIYKIAKTIIEDDAEN
ncbi:MAG: helix-turn-helix transcriptional regulator [Clostridia bacterium]|nr:helix-turn-helix transcriptional regulator [Clostridia bacterium]